MLGRGSRRVVVLLGIGGGSYAVYQYAKRSDEQTTSGFTAIVKQNDPQGNRVLVRMPFQYTNKTLEERTKQFSKTLIAKKNGLLVQWSAAQLNSNDPIEDMEPDALLFPFEDSTRTPLLVAAVADGHSGRWTSAFLKQRLASLVASRLINPGALLSTDIRELSKTTFPLNFRLNPDRVSAIIKHTFLLLDAHIVKELPRRLQDVPLSERTKELYETTIYPAVSGACALLSVVDTENEQVWVACTGDCRAVAGYWDENSDGTGSWRVDVLSEDQTGKNLQEVQRLRYEHPRDEADDVVKRGRVLGHLEPTRAFGDLRYKWTVEDQQTLLPTLMPLGSKIRPPPPLSKTPPYVTASPEVQYRKFSLPSSPSSKSTLRFLILATDGLWDELTSQQAVALVGAHILGHRGSISRKNLEKKVSVIQQEPKGNKPSTVGHNPKGDASQNWAFREEGLGIHLIRNALGGDDLQVKQSLSIPAPWSRQFRDDITVSVITFADPVNNKGST